MTKWNDPEPTGRVQGLYAQWWEAHGGRTTKNMSAFQNTSLRRANMSPYRFRDTTFPGLSALSAGTDAPTVRMHYEIDDDVPIPDYSLNPDWNGGDDWLTPSFDEIPASDVDTVILGIIDTGIPIGHRRFCMQDGRTRILASWQQTATFAGQGFLPFGRELHGLEIDDLIDANTHGGRLDEDALNRSAGLVEPQLPTGHRDLDYRASHGAHVLDLAAGIDAHVSAENAELARRLRILAVNLPPQFLHGPAGDYLQFFASWGVRRIVGLAAALWKRDHDGHPQGAFPLVLNMSYGMQAGPKDGSMLLERLMHKMIDEREPSGSGGASPIKPPLRVQMPAGNSNLYRCSARLKLDPDNDAVLGWRIQPGDQTSNHVEIWSPPFDSSDPLDPADFAMALAEPNRPADWAPTPILGHCVPFATYARLCCHEHEVDADVRRIVFLISVAQTFGVDRSFSDLAPAGLWKILLRGPQDLEIDAFVQSDQSFVLESPIGRRSYFDDRGYRHYWESGRVADTFHYGTGRPAPGTGPVWRRGTHNALGSGPKIATVGGYRLNDGMPAVYSSSGWSGSEIVALYPSEDGFAHPGLVASGSRSGSTARFSGTSMSTALATRDVALGMLAHGGDWTHPGLFDQAATKMAADAEEAMRPPSYKDVDAVKGGAGRIGKPPVHREKKAVRP